MFWCGQVRERVINMPTCSLRVPILTSLSLILFGMMTIDLAAENARPPLNRRGIGDPGELEAFVDGLMAAGLTDKHVAGAVVAVVKDGALFFAKGYGYADVERRKPVDPEQTLFRIGSITKLFTWTAVMELVEEGKLILDEDVNRYLDFQIPATYPQPITVKHLLTHTAGFEDDARDLWTKNAGLIIPLSRWVSTRMPARVRPPGVYASYSNYATALAGYLVERASGMSWDDYIERRILKPLDMSRTTGRQPLPARFANDMSQGYRYSMARLEPQEWELLKGAAPAGSMSATAVDMARFMLSHLGSGLAGNHGILSEATAAFMHARAFEHDRRLPGFALGFYEKSSHGLRIIGHGGDTQWFHSDLALIPSENVGVFVSYNTDTGRELSLGRFLHALLDHYYPPPPGPVAPGGDARAQAARVAGEYLSNRMSYTTFQKATGLTGAVRIRANGDGSLRMVSSLGDMRLVPIEPLLYREELGTELVAFKVDGSNRVTHAFVGSLPMMALERVPWYESPRLHSMLLGLAVLVFASTVWAAVGRVIRRRFGRPRPEDALRGRSFVVCLAIVNLAFVISLIGLTADPSAVLTRPAMGLNVALALPIIGSALTVVAAFISVWQWWAGAGMRAARVRYLTVIVIAGAFAWSLSRWNLLWWRL
jgi:CubicO group peptidase (beta-lactamase class C family)